MEVLILLAACGLAISLVFISAFAWFTWHGQYDDLETPPQRILVDDNNCNTNNGSDNEYGTHTS